MKTETKIKKSLLNRFLDAVERGGNRLPTPAVLFVLLTVTVMVLSAIFAKLGTSVTYQIVDSATKEIKDVTVAAFNLLSGEGVRSMLTSVVSNYTGFVAMGMVFTVTICVAVAEGGGLMGSIVRKLVSVTPKQLITPTVILLGLLMHVASTAAYVILVPLAAVIFMAYGRHPIAGIAAAFAGCSGGYSANIILGTTDPMFAGISTDAAQLLDPSYYVNPAANWYFMIVSSFLIVAVGTFVTDKIVEPRLGKFNLGNSEAASEVTGVEKRGLKFASIATIVYIALILSAVLPENAILNPDGNILKSAFMKALIPIIGGLFLTSGIFYGIGAKTIKSDKDVVGFMRNGVASISNFLIIAFFAGQFVNAFSTSNLGTLLSVAGAEFLKNIGLVGLPLIILFTVFCALLNLFIVMDSAKWIILAPIFIPMLMQLGISPEATQAAYRIGDSVTNIISPMMGFFPLIISLCQKHDKNFGVGSLVSTMIPYTGFFLVAWIALYAVWYLIGLPLGPGSPIHYLM